MSNMQWNFPRGDGKKVGKRLEPTPGPPTDAQRLDWIERHNGFNHDCDRSEHWVTSWVFDGEPGNSGASGRFCARAAGFRDCIDKFISGDIVRID